MRYRRLTFDTAYRRLLTRQIARELSASDLTHGVLQIGAYFDLPAVLPRGHPRYAYSDGNLASRLRAPFPLEGFGAGAIRRALRYEARLAKRLSLVFTMSEYLRRSFIEDYGVPADQVANIGAGMNLPAIPQAQPDKDYSRRELLFIGIDFARKGGWQLAEAFAAVRARFPDAALHIVGPESLNLPSRLRPGIELHGFVPREDPRLQALFRRSSLFVVPSLYEPFGIAPIEAAAHQLPAVVSDGWALRETVLDGKTGALVRPGEVGDLADLLCELLNSPDRLRRMGEAARERALRQYTWDVVAERLDAALNRCPAH